jgi:hypothetical protein
MRLLPGTARKHRHAQVNASCAVCGVPLCAPRKFAPPDWKVRVPLPMLMLLSRLLWVPVAWAAAEGMCAAIAQIQHGTGLELQHWLPLHWTCKQCASPPRWLSMLMSAARPFAYTQDSEKMARERSWNQR